MKKTLFAALALGAFACGSEETIWTLTSAGTATGTTNVTAYGLVFDINTGDHYRKSATSNREEAAYEDVNALFNLQSITLGCASSSVGFGVVLLNNLTADSVTATKTGDLMAYLSNDALTLSGGSLTLDFSDCAVVLQKDTQYRLFFTTTDYSNTAIGTQITVSGNTSASLVGYNAPNTINDRGHLGFLGAGNGPGTGQNNVAVMTMVMMTPEPATATLSLLALTGLAARRRRR